MIVLGHETIDRLNSYVPESFYLTGSRLFFPYRKNNDWDFFTAKEIKTIKFLRELGFKQITDNNYRDTNIYAIYRKGNVDVQVVHDILQKMAIQKALVKSGIMVEDKDQAQQLWNLLNSLWRSR